MYVDVHLIQKEGRIYLSSYNDEGKREISTHLPPYVFYYEDANGTYTSLDGSKLKQARFNNKRQFWREIERRGRDNVYERDVKPIFRLLEEKYPGEETPPLKICIIDFEVDKDPNRGFSNVDNPYAEINAVTIRNKWMNKSFTLAVPPPTLTYDEARILLDSPDNPDSNKTDTFGPMIESDGYYLCENEQELLKITLEVIQDADVITGWNSSFYDLPYFIARIRIALGGEGLLKVSSEDGSKENPFDPSHRSQKFLNQLNLFPCLPEMRMVERYGKFEKTFDLFGRVHLDYLEIYRKFTKMTRGELHSYTLDNIMKLEISESKVPYQGTLDKLYREDFRTFVAYNRQDVDGLSRMDDQLQMIELASKMSHMAGVTLSKVLGSVTIIEQAILKNLHKTKRISYNKPDSGEHHTIPGAYVVLPVRGKYQWLCSFDIASLYPSVIRSLNISPEAVIGQFELPKTESKIAELISQGMEPAEAWGMFTGVYEYHDIVEESEEMLTFQVEDTDDAITLPAKEWKKILRKNNWGLSANGTVFDLAKEGIVPECLTTWYNTRKEYQASKKKASKTTEVEYYDMLQMVYKIFLNSTYGAYLNKGFRFYDPRLGRSVTLTGRIITKHMIRQGSKLLTGDYGFNRNAVIYGDTDSLYMRLDWFMTKNNMPSEVKDLDEIVAFADDIGMRLNKSFPIFMDENTFVGKKRGGIISAGREVVGRTGMFKDVKKRYAIHVLDKEGERVNEMVIKGMETRRSDTPKYIQEFLEEMITAVGKHDKEYEYVKDKVEAFRSEFRKLPEWRRGTPCRVSNVMINTKKLDAYERAVESGFVGVKKPRTHWSVPASRNTNILIDRFSEKALDYVRDGDKAEILYLLPNEYDFRTVAIKVDEVYVPEWFKTLPFDNEKHERKLVYRKMQNVIGDIMDWEFEPINDYRDEVFIEEEFF